jgi:2-amino-4-hydroxy-6-hydroxymethyldihydropteridine diphosphokinase
MTVAYLGIGSNVGDREGFCRRAVGALEQIQGIAVETTSSLYETAPIGPPQRSYVNAAIRIRTELDARSLLEECRAVEVRLGREPSELRWGPRVIDIDLLLYGDEKIVEPDLEVPHPQMTKRRFVLVPLLEIDPGISDPWGTPYSEFLDEAEGEVELLGR